MPILSGIVILSVVLSIQIYFFPLLQIVYFGRYQLIFAILLLGFATFANRVPTMFGNLLILEDWFQIALVTLLAYILALTTMFTWLLFWDRRNRLIEIDFNAYRSMRCNRLNIWLDTISGKPIWQFLIQWRTLLAALTALPLLWGIWTASEHVSLWERVGGFIVGTLLAVGFYGLLRFIHAKALKDRFSISRDSDSVPFHLSQAIQRLVKRLPSSITEGYGVPNKQGITKPVATGFVLLTGMIYVLGLSFPPPLDSKVWALESVPALAFILLLLILATWTFPAAAFFLDRFNVPLGLLLILTSIWFSAWTDMDYYYELSSIDPPTEHQMRSLPPSQLVSLWNTNHAEDNDPIVIVTASGGGISSAVWTTKVLTGLQERLNELGAKSSIPDLGERFSKSILMIASASGGSVGSMYYVDAYKDGNPPASDSLKFIVDAAATSSLSASTWGLVFSDIWQLLLPPALKVSPWRNRGWAMERNWTRYLTDENATLNKWREDLWNGHWRPAIVFNTTVAEDGGLLIFTPIDPPDMRFGTRYSREYYKTYDINVSTAARMSATFPYVSPIARPLYDGQVATDATNANSAYHLADGGYHDNFGIVSTLELLQTGILSKAVEYKRDILIIDIRLSPPLTCPLPAGQNATWLYSVAGPALTMFNIQGPTQINRSSIEYHILKTEHEKDIDIETITFYPFRTSDDGSIPLSWHLSAKERDFIEGGWDNAERNRTTKVNSIKDFFLFGTSIPQEQSTERQNCSY